MSKPTNPWSALDQLMRTEPMGADWFTIVQFAVRYNMSVPGAGQRLTRMRLAGQLDHWKGLTTGSRRVINKYRLKTK